MKELVYILSFCYFIYTRSHMSIIDVRCCFYYRWIGDRDNRLEDGDLVVIRDRILGSVEKSIDGVCLT